MDISSPSQAVPPKSNDAARDFPSAPMSRVELLPRPAMVHIAIKMLMGDRAKYLGIILGITFTSFVITQQTSIFIGLMTRTFGFITDTSQPDLWIMDPKVQFVDDIKPMQDTQLFRVRGISGIEWAMPLYKGLLRTRLANGTFQTCNVIGIDDATLIGGPPVMVEGSLADLRRADGVIVDVVGAKGKLAKPASQPNLKPTPLKVGDILELNDHRAIVVGLAQTSRTFQSQPTIYTTYSRATTFAPRERKLLSFILAKVRPGQSAQTLAKQIREQTGLAAYTQDEFIDLTLNYFIKNTGIPINFGIAIILGFIVGTAVAGQTFYQFIQDNLRYFGTLKAMGAGTRTLLSMVCLQALIVGLIGYGLGAGGAALFGYGFRNTELAFRLVWQLLGISGIAVILICIFSALFATIRVIRLDPAIVFKS